MTELVLNEDIHQRVIVEMIPRATRFLWIVTADLKDLHVKKQAVHPFLEILPENQVTYLCFSGSSGRLTDAEADELAGVRAHHGSIEANGDRLGAVTVVDGHPHLGDRAQAPGT